MSRITSPRHPGRSVIRIEYQGRQPKYSARRIATKLAADGPTISVRTAGENPLHLGLNRCRPHQPRQSTAPVTVFWFLLKELWSPGPT